MSRRGKTELLWSSEVGKDGTKHGSVTKVFVENTPEIEELLEQEERLRKLAQNYQRRKQAVAWKISRIRKKLAEEKVRT